MPEHINGDKTWFEFVVRKLILNGINRQTTVNEPIKVNIKYIVDIQEWEGEEQLDMSFELQCNRY